jgi:hypothetical protein
VSSPFSTLYLDPQAWDLVPDASGNIALATPPYAVSQDVASVCRTFYGEPYYDSSAGVQYLGVDPPTNEQSAILGKSPPLNVLQGALAAAALTVPSVDSASCVISSFINRQAAGQVQFETEDGTELAVAIA